MILDKDLKKLTPGNILKIIITCSNISEDDLIKYALVNKCDLHYIIHGNKLIPYSIALYLKQIIGLNIEFWSNINDAFCKEKNLKYIGTELGYEMLFNKIVFEK